MGLASVIQNKVWPQVPEAVRDAYILTQYERLRGMAPLLYFAIILVIGGAVAGSPESPVWIRVGIPALVVCIAVWRMFIWIRRPHEVADVSTARKLVMRAELISALTAIPCSIWCINSWMMADADRAMYFPLLMSMGTLSTTFCLSSLRMASTGHLLIGFGPITLAMLFSGDQMATAAAGSMIVAAGFLIALQHFQHQRFIELLELQNRMVVLSQTDPLTGLANRRALQERLEQAVHRASEGCGPSLLLLDLDGFKPVNDRHGHAAGDEVLRQVAIRLTDIAGIHCVPSRIGGDEFAILVLPQARRSAEVIGTALLAALALPFEFEGHRLHVGASIGISAWPANGASLDELLRVADRALYVAKAGQDTDNAAKSGIQTRRKA